MISSLKSRLVHRHAFVYLFSNGDPAKPGDYLARDRFVTRRCSCGASGHNLGYAPARADFV